MTLFENVRQALAGLAANKMRSLLTMLGIIIGIGSVIAIMSVGDAMTNAVSGSLSGIGVNKVIVMVYPKDIRSQAVYSDGDLFTDEMLEAYEERFASELEGVALSQSAGSGTVTKRHRSYQVSVTGVNADYALASSSGELTMLQGRFITDSDVGRAGSVIVISEKLAGDLFPNETAVGQELRVELAGGMETLRIVGVYDSPEQQQSTMMFGTGLATDALDTPSADLPLESHKVIGGPAKVPIFGEERVSQHFSHEGVYDEEVPRSEQVRVASRVVYDSGALKVVPHRSPSSHAGSFRFDSTGRLT